MIDVQVSAAAVRQAEGVLDADAPLDGPEVEDRALGREPRRALLGPRDGNEREGAEEEGGPAPHVSSASSVR